MCVKQVKMDLDGDVKVLRDRKQKTKDNFIKGAKICALIGVGYAIGNQIEALRIEWGFNCLFKKNPSLKEQFVDALMEQQKERLMKS